MRGHEKMHDREMRGGENRMWNSGKGKTKKKRGKSKENARQGTLR